MWKPRKSKNPSIIFSFRFNSSNFGHTVENYQWKTIRFQHEIAWRMLFEYLLKWNLPVLWILSVLFAWLFLRAWKYRDSEFWKNIVPIHLIELVWIESGVVFVCSTFPHSSKKKKKGKQRRKRSNIPQWSWWFVGNISVNEFNKTVYYIFFIKRTWKNCAKKGGKHLKFIRIKNNTVAYMHAVLAFPCHRMMYRKHNSTWFPSYTLD